MKPNPNHRLTLSSQDTNHGGSFATGFLVGVVTGAIGLWTAQNEQAKTLLEELKKEFLKTLEEEANTPLPAIPAAPANIAKTGKKFPKFSASKTKRS